ncbi:MAG: arginyltransferase [Nevskia sp.]|nr:arginyltransferase [Nevskia sp.]
MKLQSLRLLLGSSHPCGYLPARSARSAFVDPAFRMDSAFYGALLDQGFRRSGNYAYRPMCQLCQACRSVRIVAASFTPSRSQRRCLRDNADVRLLVRHDPGADHFALYRRYLEARHPGGGMDPEDSEAFHEFLGCNWGRTEFWEFRAGDRLLAVSVVDRVPRGFSAVYSFFAPDEPARGLGTFAILQQVQRARQMGLPYVYLGYWVAESAKMNYKRNFRPMEVLTPGGWAPLERFADGGGFADNAASVTTAGHAP